jgi:organic radical activating enzyme
VSLVGGEPLLRHRELDRVLPVLSARGRVSLVVTSGVLPIPRDWTRLPRVTVSVSVDGLPRDHDVRRHPATYDRILRNIDGCRVCLHWTIVRQQIEQPGYLEEYLSFWNRRAEVDRILVSLYSPQRGEQTTEMLPTECRREVAARAASCRSATGCVAAPQELTDAFVTPPKDARSCTYALISRNYTADLTTTVEPCVLGGAPDCSECGCAVSAALHGVAGVKLLGPLKVRHLIRASTSMASLVTRIRRSPDPARIELGRS